MKKVSRNREDYSPVIHAFIEIIAERYEGGDLDKAWNDYFDDLEKSDEDERVSDSSEELFPPRRLPARRRSSRTQRKARS